MSRRPSALALLTGALLVAGAFIWRLRPSEPLFLPPAQRYVAPAATSTGPVPSVPTPASSTGPLADGPVSPTSSSVDVSFPAALRLDVPFLSQAPKQDWSLPYQEACEEASMLMVQGYFSARAGNFTPDEGDRAIVDLVAWEAEHFGDPGRLDLSAAEVAEVVNARFPELFAQATSTVTAALIRSELAQGRPVIVPADGKLLPNPHFRNGGPPYHMLVVTGYTEDGQWITNDPGTKFGEDFLYGERALLDSIRDWNGGDVPHGAPRILLIRPKT